MIKLENVSTRNILSGKTNIENYQQLADEIEKQNVQFYQYIKALCATENKVDKANKLGNEPKIYMADGFSKLELDERIRKVLDYTDKSTNANVLLYPNPLSDYSVKTSMLSNYSIYDIKKLLEHCVVDQTIKYGENALVHYTRQIGYKDVEKILFAIKLYEEQVLRQLENKKVFKINTNLFYSDYIERNMLVQQNIDDIVNYLIENGQLYVWGNMSVAKKKDLINSFSNNPTKKEMDLKSNFVNIITNYTSLSDYENDVIKEKTLKRFIVK